MNTSFVKGRSYVFSYDTLPAVVAGDIVTKDTGDSTPRMKRFRVCSIGEVIRYSGVHWIMRAVCLD